MTIELCTAPESEFSIFDGSPGAEVHENVVYMPIPKGAQWEANKIWGLYSGRGDLVEAAAYIRGPGPRLIGQSRHLDIPHDVDLAEDADYLFLGILIPHYGHFLLSVLSRLWMRRDMTKFKIVCHHPVPLRELFARPHIREIFAAAGIGPDNFVTFDHPTKIPRITVPRPTCQELNFGYSEYRELCHDLGGAMLRNVNPVKRKAVWFSKTRLAGGVRKLRGEEELEALFKAHGVDIVHSQELSVAEQIGIYADAQVVMGTVGSAFHTSIFTSPVEKMVALNFNSRMNANFQIIDTLNGNQATYLFDTKTDATRGAGNGFMVEHAVTDVRGIFDRIIAEANL